MTAIMYFALLPVLCSAVRVEMADKIAESEHADKPWWQYSPDSVPSSTVFGGFPEMKKMSANNLKALSEQIGEAATATEQSIAKWAFETPYFVVYRTQWEFLDSILKKKGLVPKADRDDAGEVTGDFGKYFEFENRFYGAYSNVFGAVGGALGNHGLYSKNASKAVVFHLKPTLEKLWGSTAAGHGFATRWLKKKCEDAKDVNPDVDGCKENVKKETMNKDGDWKPSKELLAAFGEQIFVPEHWHQVLKLQALNGYRNLKEEKKAEVDEKMKGLGERNGDLQKDAEWWTIVSKYRMGYIEAKHEGKVELGELDDILLSDETYLVMAKAKAALNDVRVHEVTFNKVQ